MRFALIFALFVSGCSDGEAEMLAGMSTPERESYAAIKEFNLCMKPHVDAAKRGSPLAERQIDVFGLKCPKDLEQVAKAMAKRPLWSFHGAKTKDEWISDFDERVTFYRKLFAGSFHCDLTPDRCPIM